MPPGPDWLDPKTNADLAALDPPGFAQEFLRRNPEYRRQYRLAMSQVAQDTLDQTAATAAIARSWGLCFPV